MYVMFSLLDFQFLVFADEVAFKVIPFLEVSHGDVVLLGYLAKRIAGFDNLGDVSVLLWLGKFDVLRHFGLLFFNHGLWLRNRVAMPSLEVPDVGGTV